MVLPKAPESLGRVSKLADISIVPSLAPSKSLHIISLILDFALKNEATVVNAFSYSFAQTAIPLYTLIFCSMSPISSKVLFVWLVLYYAA